MLIETDRRLRVVGESNCIKNASQIIAQERPDLILVDLPDQGSREDLPSTNDVKVPILILVGQHDTAIYQECLKVGISGLIQKSETSDSLFKAIEKIHNGEMWFDRSMMGETIRQLLHEKRILREFPKAHTVNELTDRENQVVELICQGMKNRDIADQLFITETTVRHHLTSVFNKLEIGSRLELVVYAFKNNLVKTPNGNGPHTVNGLSPGEFASQAV
jgi:DNA-binding NarL/FixJ family response regulator